MEKISESIMKEKPPPPQQELPSLGISSEMSSWFQLQVQTQSLSVATVAVPVLVAPLNAVTTVAVAGPTAPANAIAIAITIATMPVEAVDVTIDPSNAVADALSNTTASLNAVEVIIVPLTTVKVVVAPLFAAANAIAPANAVAPTNTAVVTTVAAAAAAPEIENVENEEDINPIVHPTHTSIIITGQQLQGNGYYANDNQSHAKAIAPLNDVATNKESTEKNSSKPSELPTLPLNNDVTYFLNIPFSVDDSVVEMIEAEARLPIEFGDKTKNLDIELTIDEKLLGALSNVTKVTIRHVTNVLFQADCETHNARNVLEMFQQPKFIPDSIKLKSKL